jgi:hypothetical protein
VRTPASSRRWSWSGKLRLALSTVPRRCAGTDRLRKRIYEREHYDRDDLPKGPHAEGGGEADAPQHYEGCGQFLGNPLTVDGLICVENMIRDYLTTKKVSGVATDAVIEWADFYKDELDFRRIVLEALKE